MGNDLRSTLECRTRDREDRHKYCEATRVSRAAVGLESEATEMNSCRDTTHEESARSLVHVGVTVCVEPATGATFPGKKTPLPATKFSEESRGIMKSPAAKVGRTAGKNAPT